MECTDCEHCASFADGYRVICMQEDLPPNEVCKYPPVNNRGDVWECIEFSDLAFLRNFRLISLQKHKLTQLQSMAR